MPILPLDHLEPFAATLGVMLSPGKDEDSQNRARVHTARFLAQPIQTFLDAGYSLPNRELTGILLDSAVALDDTAGCWWDGITTGETFKTYFALAQTDETLASWANATRLAEQIAARFGVPGSRTSLYGARSRFLPVAHLWAAWCIRERAFRSNPEVGYESWHDFQFFLAEAEILRRWGQSWRPRRKGSRPPLPAECWCVPEEWQPPESQAGWPQTGTIPAITVPENLLRGLRGPGRPRRSV